MGDGSIVDQPSDWLRIDQEAVPSFERSLVAAAGLTRPCHVVHHVLDEGGGVGFVIGPGSAWIPNEKSRVIPAREGRCRAHRWQELREVVVERGCTTGGLIGLVLRLGADVVAAVIAEA